MADNPKFKEMMAKLQQQIDQKKREAAAKAAGAAAAAPPPAAVPPPPPPETKAEAPAPTPAAPVAAPAPAPAPAEEKAEEKAAKKLKVTGEKKVLKPLADASPTLEAGTPGPTVARAGWRSTTPARLACPPVPSGSMDDLIRAMVADGIKECMANPMILAGKPTKMRVGATYKKSGEIIKDAGGDMETIETPVFLGPTATVSCGVSRTVNLGDYESAKFDVFVSVPCYLGEEQAAFEYAKKFATEKLAEQVKMAKVK